MSASYTFTTDQIIGAAVLVSTGAVVGCILVMKGTDVCVKLSSSGATIWLSKSTMAGRPAVPTPPISSSAPIPPSHWQKTKWHSQTHPPKHDYYSSPQSYGHDSWRKTGGGQMAGVGPMSSQDPWGLWQGRGCTNAAFWLNRSPARSNRWQ